MKCPNCGENTPDSWESPTDWRAPDLSVSWMRCANNECQQIVIRMTETLRVRNTGYLELPYRRDTWMVYPRSGSRSVHLDKSIVDPYRTDFLEANSVLDISPRLSAVMSRRILADLLLDFAKLSKFNLSDRIDDFKNDTSRPYELRQNLHYLRELGDFVAHTQKDDQARIVNVDAVEAEWTLDVIERLFDYFIVTPTRDKEMRSSIDEKLKETGRKAIKPLPDEPEQPPQG